MKEMKKIIPYLIFLIIPLTIPPIVAAQSNDALILSGNQAFSEGKFNDAIGFYSKVIDNHFESSELYYNLANSYFKTNDIPSAILYYEKAKKLNPKDEDINFNLNLANSRITDKIEPVPDFFLKRWLREFGNIFNVDAWARVSVITFILSLVCASFFVTSGSVMLRKLAFWAGTILLLLAIVSFTFGFHNYKRFTRHNEGIIFTSTVTVKSSPNENSVDLFVIHEGTKISIMDKVESWSEIRVANGSVGWVHDSVYKTI
jgi:tetratricopeptide (TPR) repeat protein